MSPLDPHDPIRWPQNPRDPTDPLGSRSRWHFNEPKPRMSIPERCRVCGEEYSALQHTCPKIKCLECHKYYVKGLFHFCRPSHLLR